MMSDDLRQRDGEILEGLSGGILSAGDLDDAPESVRSFVRQLGDILNDAKTAPPHVCPPGCHCRQAYRRAIAKSMAEEEYRQGHRN